MAKTQAERDAQYRAKRAATMTRYREALKMAGDALEQASNDLSEWAGHERDGWAAATKAAEAAEVVRAALEEK
jgi:hypothetical protein